MLIYSPECATSVPAGLIGDKAANLDSLTRSGFRVPSWCVITAKAFDQFASELIRNIDPEKIESELKRCVFPNLLHKEVITTLEHLGLASSPLAVRSSAIGEDGTDASFAGQLSSYLFIPPNEAANAIVNVWASSFTPHALQYFKSKNIMPDSIKVAVILQEMIDADLAGVVFTMDPVSGNRRSCVISSVYGLGEGLVSGQLDSDTYTVVPSQAAKTSFEIKPVIVRKVRAVRFDSHSGKCTRIEDVPGNLQNQPSLDSTRIFEINGVARDIAALFRLPQDIEWAIKDSTLYILQSRPVTTINKTPDRSQVRRIWDNSNIIESYSGVTTPLTFTFVQDVYSEVYRQFCRIMGVENRIIDLNSDIFKMLGLHDGRIYYNLLNWYKALSLLPGYSINASFMEQMMGVREKLRVPPTVIHSKRLPWLQVTVLILSLIKNLITIKGQIKAFYKHFNASLTGCEPENIHLSSIQELTDLFRRLEKALLRKWQAPLINDFYAMIFHGLLKKSLTKWCSDKQGTIANDLLCGEGGIISTEPVESLFSIALSISKNADWIGLFSSTDDSVIVRKLGLKPVYSPFIIEQNLLPLSQKIKVHMEKYGDRCAGELKLETITPRMDPGQIIKILRHFIAQDTYNPQKNREKELEIRSTAEMIVATSCGRSIIRKAIIKILTNQTRARVKERENLRFERTRLFAVIRNIFCAIGKRLQEEGLIDDSRDVFYLTKDEIFAFIEGTSVIQNVKQYIGFRKKEFSDYKNVERAGRFETFGPPIAGNVLKGDTTKPVSGSGVRLQGTGCCCGIVRSKVKVIHDPSCDISELKGCILVAERTDPGWTLLFPFVSGILVERGSLLSHTAIVAREMGIPAIVGIENLTSLLKDGMLIEMDGSTGSVLLKTNE